MNSKKQIHKFYLTAFILSFSFWGNTQTIANSGFEYWPELCSIDLAPTGWDIFGSDAGPDQRGEGCEGEIEAYEGNSYVSLLFLSGAGVAQEGVSQHVWDLTIGKTYSVTFHAIPCDVFLYTTPMQVGVGIDDEIVYLSTSLEEEDTTWQEFSFTFTAADTDIDLSFEIVDGLGDCSVASIGIDAISISAYVGLDEEETASFSVYPNPVNDVLLISGTMTEGTSLQILDAVGKTVLTSTYGSKGVDVSSLPAGVYFIQNSESNNEPMKFIKQ